jgi:hypothetical protein
MTARRVGARGSTMEKEYVIEGLFIPGMACSVISPAKENANNLIRTICFREKLV